MPATQKTAGPTRATTTAHARAEDNALIIERVQDSLEVIQKDLGSLGGSLETGMRDLQRDAMRLVHDARRDMVKMRKAVQRDLERLQKDLITATKPPAAGRPATASRRTGSGPARSARRQTAASSH